MKVSTTSITLAALSLIPSAILAAIQPITVSGTKFFYANGTQFYIQGVAYQPAIGNGTNEESTGGFVDPLAEPAGCNRDIPLLQALNVNVIRTYAIDTTKDHSACVQAFAEAGIYLISDLSAPGANSSIDRNTPTWTVDIFQRYASVIDEFAQYNNVLGFFAGNEVTNNNSNTDASAFVKAAIRDTKAYIAAKGYRSIPIGYAANDDSITRLAEAEYFACGPSSASADFYGINMYEWCGNATFESSGYEARTQEFSNYSVPIFFSEYGCNVPEPRSFSEVQAIYGDQMTGVWSGGIVYEYFQETNDYGLVSQSGSSVSLLPDYTALSSQLNNIDPTRVQSATYTPTNSPPSCPSPVTGVWDAATSLPPTPDGGLCNCLMNSLSCIADPSLSATNISNLFGYLCGSAGLSCDGIKADGFYPGQYGAFSPCDSIIKLSWLMNEYYLAQNKAPGACQFNGQATTQKAQSPSGTCSQLLSEAGAAGTGVVTSTNGVGSSGSKSAASTIPGTWGDLRIMTVIVGAFMAGVLVIV